MHVVPTTSLSSNSFSKNITKSEISIQANIFRLANRGQIFTLLKQLNKDGMKKKPITKPPPCFCQHCVFVDNLPIGQYAVNYHFKPYTNSKSQYSCQNNKLLYNDLYSSNKAVSDCSRCASKGIYTTNYCNCINQSEKSESFKDIWIKELVALIKANDEKYNASKKPSNNSTTSSSGSCMKAVLKKVNDAAEHIKTHLSECKICKKSKFYGTSLCICLPDKKKKTMVKYQP